ncbi:hypothetical protein KUTeg_006566 [Tegillarca granosa]|uniref:Transposase Helix-turn-helix domain-containing protein n=1 Tax=Tegillarca granosa TaxID=220873 RepID=A0ABQ9FF11_TEGGR|nr:hypothetical protein KUTeg_006566 [Tegillarca granosa]
MAGVMLFVDNFLESNDLHLTTDLLISKRRRYIHILSTVAKRNRRKKIRITNYIETVMPLYMVDDFRDRFRMDRDTFDVILEQVTPRLLIGDRNCPVKISAEKQLLIYIKYLATQMTIQTLSDLFGVCEATIFRLIRKISGIICKDVMPDVIKWPSGQKIPRDST